MYSIRFFTTKKSQYWQILVVMFALFEKKRHFCITKKCQ